MEVAESVGLPRDEARKILEERGFKDAIDADWAKSRRYGVTGVPTFLSGGRGLVGVQSYEALTTFLKGVGAAPKKQGGTE